MVRKLFLGLLLFFPLGCAAVAVHSGDKPSPVAKEAPEDNLQADHIVAPYLVALLEERKLKTRNIADYENVNSALKDIVRFTTPAGYSLRTRLQNNGIPVAQALSLSRHEQIKSRLLEAARWAYSPRTREQALLGLAALKQTKHLNYFKEALLDKDISVQFAAVEALQIFGGSYAVSMLLNTADSGWSPLIRVYAAQAVWRMGEERGKTKIRSLLRDPNWLVRAMAAKTIGELGKAQDANLLLSRIGPEKDHKFVLAEACIGALKLLGKKSSRPRRPKRRQPKTSAKAPPPSSVYELEPLVVTAPRLKIQIVDVRIDNNLVQILNEIMQNPPPEGFDPVLEELSSLQTPLGIALKIRYTDISVLLAEGLAGTRNFSLIRKLEEAARQSLPWVRASILLALGYEPGRRDLFIFEEALKDKIIGVRFGAVDALSHIRSVSARNLLIKAAQYDASLALRVYAAQALWQQGDTSGREVMLRLISHQDWVIRGMCVYYLGEMGGEEEFNQIAYRLRSETNDFVKAEACLALLKLSKG